jgi:outer membrane protein assembly factor BamB
MRSFAMPLIRLLVVLLTAATCTVAARADDWPRFRGPAGQGSANDGNLPVRWSDDENIAWKTELPGHGSSSPVTWGDKIFLTSYSGYGVDENDPGDPQNLVRHLLCLDRREGKILWSTDVPARLPEEEFGRRLALHGYASSTPATDGQRVYAFFGKSGVMAFDFAGKPLWTADVGKGTHQWGSSNSPLLYHNLVIVNASVESGSLVALDKQSGSEVWRAKGMNASWNTPILVDTKDGRQELVVSVRGKILGFDPASGEQLWSCDGIEDYVCPSVVAEDGVVYAIGGRRNTAVAVRVGGRGDVTETHRVWKAAAGSNVSSPVIYHGHLYWVSEQGIAYCLKADSGEIVYRERLNTGLVYSSATVADGKLYIATREKGTYVLAAKPKFEVLAHNTLADDSIFNGSPVVSDGQLLLRSDRFLYCIGKRK